MPEVQNSMLMEHQAPDSVANRPASYIPNDEERKAIKKVEQHYEKAKKARKAYDEKWLEYYKMFRGRQWKDSRPSYRHSEVINLVFRAIQSEVPILTDTRPKMEFIPENPQDLEIAAILNQVLDYDWNTNNWLYNLTEIIYDAHIYGTGFGCVKYDSKANLGVGAVTFKSQDPFYFYPDPDALNINERCDYVVYAEPTPIGKLKKKYPDKAEYLTPDLVDVTRTDKQSLDQVRYQSPTDNRVAFEGQRPDEVGSKDQILVVTCYSRDDDFDEEEKEENGERKYVQKLKYPNGRRTVIASGVLLEDGPNPYDDGEFPYARLSNYILPREFWGISEVEQLISPQRIFNKLVSYALDVLVLMGNPIWVVDNTSGVDTDNLFNRPGLILEKEPNSEVRREEGVQLQPFVLQMIDRMKVWFDDISGSNDASRGVRPEGITAASAITALQESSQTRLRQKSRNIDAFLQDVGQLYLSRVFQFYSTPQIVRITENQNAQRYFKMSIAPNEANPDQKVVNLTEYGQAEDGNVYEMQSRQMIIQGKFDVRVTTGSTLPFAKTEKTNLVLQLFDRGIVDEEEVLKASEYPNWQSVLERVNQKKEQLKQEQLAQQGQPPPQ